VGGGTSSCWPIGGTHLQPARQHWRKGWPPGRPVAGLDERAFAAGRSGRGPQRSVAVGRPMAGGHTYPLMKSHTSAKNATGACQSLKDTLEALTRRNSRTFDHTDNLDQACQGFKERGAKSACFG